MDPENTALLPRFASVLALVAVGAVHVCKLIPFAQMCGE